LKNSADTRSDRYLTANAKWAAQIRAQQGVMQVELQRLREQVERLTAYQVGLCLSLRANPQGNSVPDALRACVKIRDLH
jgi:hypothetical protein